MTTTPSPAPALDQEPDVPLLTAPADGLPPVVETPEALAAAVERLVAGEGPVAVDAERAHGFRYSQRAYLIQLRRAGAGTHLIDPVAFGEPADLRALGTALQSAEWVIHAASQDLACLYEVGMTPPRLFDTELAARLLGYPRVALGTMVEQLLGVRLLKEHSAADWSTRPLPSAWLSYAALDVELLLDLRDVLAAELEAAGKTAWAQQEFAALVAGVGREVAPRRDPWRRTSGIHKVRSRRGLAYVAELWYARDRVAAELDRAPGKILADAGIAELAATGAPSRVAMRRIPAFSRRQARAFETEWLAAVDRVGALRDDQLPALHIPAEGPPQARLWPAKDPVAAARLVRMRDALAGVAADVGVPVENLVSPDSVRRVAWQPPDPASVESVDAALLALGARPWQRELTAAPLADAITGEPLSE